MSNIFSYFCLSTTSFLWHSNDVIMSCTFPFMVANPSYPKYSVHVRVPVPCGKCPQCLQRRASEWCFRLLQHEKITQTSCFLTLTYNTDYVPISKSGFLTLDKTAFPVFIRSVRKRNRASAPLSYYAVGEYGTLRRRPHYHAIVFNLPDIVWKTDNNGLDIGYSPLVSSSWPYGVVDIRRCNGDTVAYVCKYLHKGKSVPAHLNDDRVREFSLMSKGLGANYITPATLKYHNDDIFRQFVTSSGFKKAMPRYYRKRIYVCPVVKLAQQLAVEELNAPVALAERADYLKRHGSMLGYTRSIFHARQAELINFKVRAASKRKDL